MLQKRGGQELRACAKEVGQQAVNGTLQQCCVEVKNVRAQVSKMRERRPGSVIGNWGGRENAKELHRRVQREKAKERHWNRGCREKTKQRCQDIRCEKAKDAEEGDMRITGLTCAT
jgi:hypothetical protein